MKKRLLCFTMLLTVAISAITFTNNVKAATKWNTSKSVTKEENGIKYSAYLTEDGKESWIYQIKLSKKITKLTLPKEINQAKLTRVGFGKELYNKGEDEDAYQNLFGDTIEPWHNCYGDLSNDDKNKQTIETVAIPGTVNKTSVIKSVNLNLENYNIVEALKKKINIPIKIKNDAKCAALAENKYGSLKDYKRSIFIGLGTGIGGAVIVDDKLLDTGDLPGCEIGHMIIQKDGLECKCGKKGCFEKYASMKAFKTNLRKELNLDEKTRGEELLNILRNNNGNNKNYKKIEKVINDYIEYLSIGISNLINIFEPEAIVIGGSFVYFEDVLLNRLYKKIIEGNLLFNKRDSLIIKLAVLGNDAGIIGASLL